MFNTIGRGGGTIKRHTAYAILLSLVMVICIFPSVGGIENQVKSNKNVNIGLNGNKIVINAAGSISTIKYYKKSKKKYKKVKATYKYKKVKIRYKYKGKWRTKWVYRKYKVVKAFSKITSTKTSSTTNYSKYIVQGNPSISSDKVSADAKCSCNLYTDYNIHKGTWANCCPYCGKSGTLSYTNQQGCPEGMFYCDMGKNGCDADFCIVHGKAHTNNGPKYLTPA